MSNSYLKLQDDSEEKTSASANANDKFLKHNQSLPST